MYALTHNYSNSPIRKTKTWLKRSFQTSTKTKDSLLDILSFLFCICKERISNGLTMKMENFFTNFYYFQECEPRVIISEILFHEWNEFHIYRQTIEFSVYYIFLAFFHMFLSNLSHFVQNMTWRHNCLLSSHCESDILDIFTVWK